MSARSLFLCHRLPFPPNKGDKIRSHALLKHLSSLGPVHVGAFVDDVDDRQYCDAVRTLAKADCKFVPLGSIDKWAGAAKALLTGGPITTSYFSSHALSQWVEEPFHPT